MSKIVNRRQAGNRTENEWYTCDRCGFQYPRPKIIVQNGLILCQGTDTTGCVDLPGHAAALAQMTLPRERPILPLPEIVEDL